MYRMYLNRMRIPVFPEKITLKINGNNKTVDLINNGEVNVIKPTGLTDIEFDLLIPNKKYPFATYGSGGFKRAWYYIKKIDRYKKLKKPFTWIVYRTLPDGKRLYSTSLLVTMENYTIKEDAKEGLDVVISIQLKQYVSYGVKKVKLVTNSDGTVSIKTKKTRTPSTITKIKIPTTHKVGPNDTIWSIAKYYYGDGLMCNRIYRANKDKMKSPEELVVGSVITIPYEKNKAWNVKEDLASTE